VIARFRIRHGFGTARDLTLLLFRARQPIFNVMICHLSTCILSLKGRCRLSTQGSLCSPSQRRSALKRGVIEVKVCSVSAPTIVSISQPAWVRFHTTNESQGVKGYHNNYLIPLVCYFDHCFIFPSSLKNLPRNLCFKTSRRVACGISQLLSRSKT
jgi:hypothetical protein